ncbi:butyrophilin subfamily 1 member A1-like [Misgurnus anguillicaudatus]|uniref:butyrophilin subfamily 1 member A1-like n=1 Tax=Misgurnus anguillicaudatus TaxID=75329 RepID=UPI003CCF5E71
MKLIYVTLLIISHITDSRADQFAVVGPAAPLFIVSGEDFILPCSLKPNISAVNMRVEWFRLDQKYSVVHLYEDHKDKNTNQLQSYRGRTEVFKDELQKGNTSIKLSRVKISDEGLYKCFIQSKSRSDDITVDLRVEALGSRPLITIDGFDHFGGVHLQCESRGWYPEPELVWLDSEGVTLTSETSDTHKDTDGYSVKHTITVQNSDSKYYCKIKLTKLMLQTEIIISTKMFNSWRTLMVVISCGVLIIVMAGMLITLLVYRKRVLYQLLQNQKRSTQNEITLLRKYEVNVTLDPDSAHPCLIVSHDGKRVRFRITQSNEEENEDEEQNNKFDTRLAVLGMFQSSMKSKRFYYEVQVKGLPEWYVGVARESINRKDKIDLNPENGYWTVGRRYGDFKACDDPHVSLSLSLKLERVGVFVNYEKGRVSFYDVGSMYHIYSFTGQTFNEKLNPFFCLGYGRKNAPLTICDDL